ncbi:MAG: hypothetical protein LC748_16535, partial [Thermomicrobia bacterium]|nr:hypothetical protein [Thermomicrobia bacterium]
HEADIVPSLVSRRALTTPPRAWAATLLAVRAAIPAITREEALAIAEQTPFNVRTSWNLLEQVYAHR